MPSPSDHEDSSTKIRISLGEMGRRGRDFGTKSLSNHSEGVEDSLKSMASPSGKPSTEATSSVKDSPIAAADAFKNIDNI